MRPVFKSSRRMMCLLSECSLATASRASTSMTKSMGDSPGMLGGAAAPVSAGPGRQMELGAAIDPSPAPLPACASCSFSLGGAPPLLQLVDAATPAHLFRYLGRNFHERVDQVVLGDVIIHPIDGPGNAHGGGDLLVIEGRYGDALDT